MAMGCAANVMKEVAATTIRVEISRSSKMLRLYVWVVPKTHSSRRAG
jgi:hypothetical protein